MHFEAYKFPRGTTEASWGNHIRNSSKINRIRRHVMGIPRQLWYLTNSFMNCEGLVLREWRVTVSFCLYS